MKPKLPLALMSGAQWNLLEAGGCRIACYEETETALARDICQMVEETARIVEAGLNPPYEALMLYYLLSGSLSREEAGQVYAEEPNLSRFAATVRAIQRHMRAERGDNPFCLFVDTP